MGGFRRGQGWPTPGMTAAPRFQGGRARGGELVGGEEAASGHGAPPPHSQLWGKFTHSRARVGNEGQGWGELSAGALWHAWMGQHGLLLALRLCAAGSDVSPNSEPQFAHLYNGNTPGRT